MIEEMTAEYRDFALKFRAFTEENFGSKCPDYYEGCPTCEMWKAVEIVEKLLLK